MNRAVTQRVVLSLVSAVYDPIGPVAPYTVTARLLFEGHLASKRATMGQQSACLRLQKVFVWAETLLNLSEKNNSEMLFSRNHGKC